MRRIYASIDIGSFSVKLLVGEIFNSSVHVLYSNAIPSHGIKKGLIVDEEAVKSDINSLINDANQLLGFMITRVLLSIPINHSRLYSSTGSVQILSDDHSICQKDIAKAIHKACQFEKKKNEAIISSIPIKYVYNDQISNQVPVGIRANKLEVDVLTIMTVKKILYPYIRVIEGCNLEIMDICIDAYCEAKEVLSDLDMQEGAVLIDIGHRSTKISFFEDDYLKYITTVPMGGFDLTKQISSSWQIPLPKAETYKIKYGSCNINLDEQDIVHSTKQDGKITHYLKKDLSMLLHDGVEEIMRSVKDKLDVLGDKEYQIFIIGGGAELDGIDKVASDVLQTYAKVYRPQVMGARKMSYVGALGLLYYLIERSKIYGESIPSVKTNDISNTMSLRLKGLTKLNVNQNEGRIKKIIDRFVADDSE